MLIYPYLAAIACLHPHPSLNSDECCYSSVNCPRPLFACAGVSRKTEASTLNPYLEQTRDSHARQKQSCKQLSIPRSSQEKRLSEPAFGKSRIFIKHWENLIHNSLNHVSTKLSFWFKTETILKRCQFKGISIKKCASPEKLGGIFQNLRVGGGGSKSADDSSSLGRFP